MAQRPDRSERRGGRSAPAALFVLILAAGAVAGAAPTAETLRAGAFSFSDELGGFRLHAASGSGTGDDPIVLEETIFGPAPAVLVIRRTDRYDAAGRRAAPAPALALVKRVVNATGHVWAGFELELQEVANVPSSYADGLSFNQIATQPPDVASDAFAVNHRMFEPHDRLRFAAGHVDPDGTVLFRLQITDPTPTAVFYLSQAPQILFSLRPEPRPRPARALAGNAGAGRAVDRPSRPLPSDAARRQPSRVAAMASTKHRKAQPGKAPRDDLVDNPGIGASKGTGMTGLDPEEIEGANTFEGDVENDTTPQGGVDPNQIGRTNK